MEYRNNGGARQLPEFVGRVSRDQGGAFWVGTQFWWERLGVDGERNHDTGDESGSQYLIQTECRHALYDAQCDVVRRVCDP